MDLPKPIYGFVQTATRTTDRALFPGLREDWPDTWTRIAADPSSGDRRRRMASWLLVVSGLALPETDKDLLTPSHELWSGHVSGMGFERAVMLTGLDAPPTLQRRILAQGFVSLWTDWQRAWRQANPFMALKCDTPSFRHRLSQCFGDRLEEALQKVMPALVETPPASEWLVEMLLDLWLALRRSVWPVDWDPLLVPWLAIQPSSGPNAIYWRLFTALPQPRQDALLNQASTPQPDYLSLVPTPARTDKVLEALRDGDALPETALRMGDGVVDTLMARAMRDPAWRTERVAAALRARPERVPTRLFLMLLGNASDRCRQHARGGLVSKGPEEALGPLLEHFHASRKDFDSASERKTTRAEVPKVLAAWASDHGDTIAPAVEALLAETKLPVAHRKALGTVQDRSAVLPLEHAAECFWRGQIDWRLARGPVPETRGKPTAMHALPRLRTMGSEPMWRHLKTHRDRPDAAILATRTIWALRDAEKDYRKANGLTLKPQRDEMAAIWQKIFRDGERVFGDRWVLALCRHLMTERAYGEPIYAYVAKSPLCPMSLHFKRLLDDDAHASREAQEVLVALGAAALDGAIALLSHSRKDARIKAAGCLYEMADKRAVTALAKALSKERSKPAVVAIERALGACLEPGSASALGLYGLTREDALNPLLEQLRDVLHGTPSPFSWARLCDLLWRAQLLGHARIGLDAVGSNHPHITADHCVRPWGWTDLEGFGALGRPPVEGFEPRWIPMSAFLEPSSRNAFMKGVLSVIEPPETRLTLDRAKAIHLFESKALAAWRWCAKHDASPEHLRVRIDSRRPSNYSSSDPFVTSLALWWGFGVSLDRVRGKRFWSGVNRTQVVEMVLKIPRKSPLRTHPALAPHITRGEIGLARWLADEGV